MSSKVEVLCPNGHRIQVKITPNTTLLKILEEASTKKGFPAADYQLCHVQSRKILDLTLSVRFAGLQNNAKLELVKVTQPRTEAKVTLAMQLPSGDRLKGEFTPAETLWSIMEYFEKNSLNCITRPESTEEGKDDTLQPVCIYMRQEIIGEYALRETTLKDLGLLSGSGILRLVHKAIEDSTLKEIKDQINKEKSRQSKIAGSALSIASETVLHMDTTPTELHSMAKEAGNKNDANDSMDTTDFSSQSHVIKPDANIMAGIVQPQVIIPSVNPSDPQLQALAQSLLPSIFPPDQVRSDVRFRSQQAQVQPPCQEQPTTFTEFKFPEGTKGQELYSNALSTEHDMINCEPCDRDVICYSMEERKMSAAVPMEPDEDFFELTVSDVQQMYSDLQHRLREDDETRLLTQAMRKAEAEQRLAKYDHVFIRFTFPDKLVLQATFRPQEPVYSLYKCVKSYLQEKTTPFYLFTSPPKNILKEKSQTLMEAKLVPMTVVYVGSDIKCDHFLSDSIQADMSCQSEANKKIVATMHRPVKRSANNEETEKRSSASRPTQTNRPRDAATDGAKVPKWFKIGKK